MPQSRLPECGASSSARCAHSSSGQSRNRRSDAVRTGEVLRRMNLPAGQPPDDRGAVFQRPAELVDIAERIFQQVFAVGLWVATGLSAFASLSSLLQDIARLAKRYHV